MVYRLAAKGSSYVLEMNPGSIIIDEPAPIVVDNGGNRNKKSVSGGNSSNTVSSNNNSNGGVSTKNSSNSNTDGNESSQDETYKGRSNCKPENVTKGQFADIKQQIESQSTEAEKAALAKRLVSGRCMTASQVAAICRLLGSDEQRIELAKYSFEYTFDADNYYMVVNSLSSDSNKNEIHSYIKSH